MQYKGAIKSGAFDKAVDRYRGRMKAKHPPHVRRHALAEAAAEGKKRDSILLSEEDANREALEFLETLPAKIIEMSQEFHDGIQFFMASSSGRNKAEMPPGLDRLLDEIAVAAKPRTTSVEQNKKTASRRMGKRVRDEVMQDHEARQKLFTVSVETALRRIIDAAEEALDAQAVRDYVVRQRTDSNPDSMTTVERTAIEEEEDAIEDAQEAEIEERQEEEMDKEEGGSYTDDMTSDNPNASQLSVPIPEGVARLRNEHLNLGENGRSGTPSSSRGPSRMVSFMPLSTSG
jgi:hypothetical protein